MKALHFLLLTLATCFLATSVAATFSCLVCNSTSILPCTEEQHGQVQDWCESCVTYDLGKNQRIRECSRVNQDETCGVMPRGGLHAGKQFCVCNSDLCNKYTQFKPLTKCHVCNSTSAADPTCTDTDLGEVTDGCSSCGVYKLDENRFRRECQSMYQDEVCLATQDKPWQQVCVCNSDLCNGEFVTSPTIRCHVCQPEPSNPNSCSDTDLGEIKDGCGSCLLWKLYKNRYHRLCSEAFVDDFCGVREYYGLVCGCKTDLCNAEDLHKSMVQCYFCNPESPTDTSCNARKSGVVHFGCMSCKTSVTEDGITARGCMQNPMEPSTVTEDVKTISYCNTHLCNGAGEGEDDALVYSSISRGLGLQKTVSSRVLIGGVLLAMLGLARFF